MAFINFKNKHHVQKQETATGVAEKLSEDPKSLQKIHFKMS